jgi:methionyl-tRNA formyltransferase
VKIVAAEALAEAGEAMEGEAPGTILGVRGGRLAVRCGGGTALGLAELQRPGKRALRAADFANGERLRAGESFT